MSNLVISVTELVDIRRKAMRKRVWFKVLDRVERAIVSLTIRCVKRVRSPKLVEIVKTIVHKLRESMKSNMERLLEIGRQLALKLSRIAQRWGNDQSYKWIKDPTFIKYLTILEINSSKLFR